MQDRLIPVNALVAMAMGGDITPAPFAQAGYALAGVEIPVLADDGHVVIDVLMFNATRNIILALESKSGANIEPVQAQRYARLRPDAVVDAASITISHAGERRIQAAYACMPAHVDRILLGLTEAGVSFPVIAIGLQSVEHRGAPFLDEALFTDGAHAVSGPWPRHIPVDEESSDEEFDRILAPTLVARLSRQQQEASVQSIAEEVLPHLTLYGKARLKHLIRKIEQAIGRAERKDPATFAYSGPTATRDFSVVRFKRSPEETAPQGRTQSYQAIARNAGKVVSNQPDQMALFDDLIDELETGGEESEEEGM